MKTERPVLLDSSFLIELERESVGRRAGRAHAAMRRVRARKLCVSVVTVEEILEGSTNREEAVRSFSSLTVQPIGWAHAIRCAALQAGSATRLAENDAWIVATAQLLDADILGRDRSAFTRLGARYLTF